MAAAEGDANTSRATVQEKAVSFLLTDAIKRRVNSKLVLLRKQVPLVPSFSPPPGVD